MNTRKIALQFIELVNSHPNWEENQPILTKDELMVLFDTVAAAGFEPKKLVPGTIRGRYTSPTLQPVNKNYPYKFVNKDNYDNIRATGWLSNMIGCVEGMRQHGKKQEEIIDEVSLQIERSQPLKPIKLTTNNDMLCELRPELQTFSPYLTDHTRDKDKMPHHVGNHKHCGGPIYRQRANTTQDVLVCRTCFLRVRIPAKIRSYRELRDYMNTSARSSN